MASDFDCSVSLGPVPLRSPIIGASGTVGSVVDFAGTGAMQFYGAMVAKSVSLQPWKGSPPPRLVPAGEGMLNRVGIQNPGIEAWVKQVGPRLADLPVPVWGSAVGHSPQEYAQVARSLQSAGVAGVEINLSCPNLEGGGIIALDGATCGQVVSAVREAVTLPVGAKLSPNASDVVGVAGAALEAGADWLVLTNTVWGSAIDIENRCSRLGGLVGGLSGPALKPIALRCVIEVAKAFPGVPIIGCGGVATGADVVEYMIAGASAVALGSIHFAEPRAARRIYRELVRWCRANQVRKLSNLTGTLEGV